MTITVEGSPDSGKSKRAEAIICEISKPDERYYVATMIPFGDEGAKRVKKHLALREGKGFVTIEQPFDVDRALEKIEEPDKATVLLECVSNLASNEMFDRGCKDIRIVTQKLVTDMKNLQKAVKNIVIVTNHFQEEPEFDAETISYIRLMNEINKELYKISDESIIL